MDELVKRTADLIVDCELGQVTIKHYLKTLLSTLWREEEGFSGKRPFGNSGWQYEVYLSMVKAGIITAELDRFGYINTVDGTQADKIIQALIESF